MANETKENGVKHTPGPWMIRHGERVYGDASRVLDADGQVVALIPPDDTIEIEDGAIAEILTPRARANAAIITAAPAMLAALRAVLPWAEGAHDGAKDCDCDRCLTTRAARAVIATAIGYKA